MIERVIRYDRCFRGKDGNLHPSENFYLVCKVNEKEVKIAIKASFKEGYGTLKLLANTIVCGDKLNPIEAPAKDR